MNHGRLAVANKKARKIFKKHHGVYPENVQDRKNYAPSVEGILGMYRKTKCFCSKACCGNPRKWRGKKTLQERKDDEKFEKWY